MTEAEKRAAAERARKLIEAAKAERERERLAALKKNAEKREAAMGRVTRK